MKGRWHSAKHTVRTQEMFTDIVELCQVLARVKLSRHHKLSYLNLLSSHLFDFFFSPEPFFLNFSFYIGYS